ncbi:MAG: xanthine dehydrogenase family protein molybdopterin-binding subunit [Ilumatobacter sp.]|uniref:xanthine dehydrogenase family protein molybdopterin-binding subunit n=1 Tax=Ilumatobacter sp. TaxID=1967498 RepID=UPI0026355A8A|nr:xanthine dehydrogenase family protein molybdopterin-binding subunit [Ilumatobacter sp.]MDJ0769192.1 xanthine dehydrogenase family protein molybdopterin-binding subunit [Ilumatobacter sp.]
MSMLGTDVIRKEDPALLTIGGTYVDDHPADGAVHAAFVRSQVAHGEIRSIETEDAIGMPGVIGIYTAADLGLEPYAPGMPMFNQDMTRTRLATDRVRYVGEPVAVVVAETYTEAVDAANAVWADVDILDAVVSMHEALTDDVVLHPAAGTNTIFQIPGSGADVFEGCDVTVELSFRNHRIAPCPLESRATIARWDTVDDVEHLTQWSENQGAHGTRDGLAAALGVDAAQVRVITPDVGGGFGAKNGNYPEDIVVAVLARRLERPVRWAETRSESMLGLVHGRGQSISATIGGTRDGNITGFRSHVIQDGGAYPEIGSILPIFAKNLATGPYDIPNVDVSTVTVATNTMPVGAYRGAGRPEAAQIIDRMVDAFALEIGMDPAEVRRKNFVAPDAFPYTNASGTTMDSGDYEGALDKVLEQIDYSSLRAEQARRRDDPSAKLLGLGWASYIEITNPVTSPDFGSIEVRPDGTALLLTGVSPHGQGHYTVFAQIASDTTGIPFDLIEVRHGDTDLVARGNGTGGSRSLQIGGSAILQASEALIEQAKDVAANLLEASRDDIVLDTATGAFSVAGTPAVSTSWGDVAAAAIDEQSSPFLAEADFQPEGVAFPFGTQLSVVEVDRETGEVVPIRHVTCDDCGVMVNPMLVAGQVHGGVASGIAQALMEEFVYDEDGNPKTANFADYGIISSAELPSFERRPQETPSPINPLGAKGIGESGTIGATPAVQNAVVDALAHLGVRHVDIPTTAERVWSVIDAATAGRDRTENG